MEKQETLFELFNGQLVPAGEPVFNSGNRALRYGDGIFETVCVRNQKPLFIEHHWARLITGLQMLQIPLPFDRNELGKHITTLLEQNNTHTCRLRLIVYRAAEGLYKPQNNSGAWHLCITGLVSSSYASELKLVAAGIYKENFKPCGKLASLKSLNGLLYVSAGLESKRIGFEEMLILNDKGRLCESISSNVFARFENKFLTPSLQEGCVDGVMRKQVIGILKAKGFIVEENAIELDDLMNADEILLTNVIRGVSAISHLDGKTYENQFGNRINSWLDASL